MSEDFERFQQLSQRGFHNFINNDYSLKQNNNNFQQKAVKSKEIKFKDILNSQAKYYEKK